MRRKPFSSSTGTKVLIAVSGLGLYAYLLVHLAGNLLVFQGDHTFNHYSHALISSPLLYPLEAALAAVFLLHVYKAAANFLKNRSARPERYHKKEWARHTSRKSVASTTMIWTGIIVLLFIIIHLKQFKFGTWYQVDGTANERNLYRTEMEILGNPLFAGFYILALVLIGFHIWHGFWSAFQSLGLGNHRWTPVLVRTAKVLSVIIAGGFIGVVLWVSVVRSRPYLEEIRAPQAAAPRAALAAPGGVR